MCVELTPEPIIIVPSALDLSNTKFAIPARLLAVNLAFVLSERRP